MAARIIKGVGTDLILLKNHYHQHGVKNTLLLMHSRDAPGIVQFAKYGICGVIAVLVQSAIFFALTLLDIFPAHESVFVDGEWLPNGASLPEREKSSIIANLIAFPAANLAAYLTNSLWVFTPGRHSKAREFWMFTGIAFFATLVALLGGPILIHRGLPAWVAQVGFVITSALVNYVCRKMLIFLK